MLSDGFCSLMFPFMQCEWVYKSLKVLGHFSPVLMALFQMNDTLLVSSVSIQLFSISVLPKLSFILVLVLGGSRFLHGCTCEDACPRASLSR